MKKLSIFLLGIGCVLSTSRAFAYGTGVSTYPLEADQKLISTEFTGITSAGGGMGLQARFTQKLNEKSTLDVGLGIAGGERSGRLFAGYDHEIIPDYESQPRLSVKAFFENSKEFEARRNILGIAPSISKGFSFWGHEAYPYLSLPYGISLNGTTQTYQSTLSANLGVTGLLPKDWSSKQLTSNAEVILGLNNSYTGVFFGVGYPIE